MGSSVLARPLAWGLVLYVALLTGLWQRGFFEVRPPPALAAWCSAPAAVVEGTLLSGVTPKRPGDRYWFRAEAVGGAPVEAAKVLVYLKRGRPETGGLRPGQRVRFTGRLRRPLRARFSGGFHEAGFLDTRGAGMVLHAGAAEVLAAPPWPLMPWAWGEAVHLSVHGWLAGRFDPLRAAVLEGLALGTRAALPTAVDRGLERAGLIQLLTPSGDKVTAVLAAAWALGLALGLKPLARGLMSLGVGAAFLCVVQCEPSHVRPWLMAAGVVAARAAGRTPGLFQAWLLAAWAALLWDPRQLFNPGFDLTYAALLAIIFVLPRWAAPPSWPPAARILWAALAFELAMQAALAPALAAFFGLVSPAACLLNPLAFPAAAIAAACVWAGWAASCLPGPLAALAGGPSAAAGLVADAFLAAAREVGPRPWAAVAVAGPGLAGAAVYGLGAGALFALPDRRVARRFAGAALVLAAAFGAKEIYCVRALSPSDEPPESATDGLETRLLPPGRRIHRGAFP